MKERENRYQEFHLIFLALLANPIHGPHRYITTVARQQLGQDREISFLYFHPSTHPFLRLRSNPI